MTHTHVTETKVIILVDIVKLKLNIGNASTRNFTFWLAIFLKKELKYNYKYNKIIKCASIVSVEQ